MTAQQVTCLQVSTETACQIHKWRPCVFSSCAAAGTANQAQHCNTCKHAGKPSLQLKDPWTQQAASANHWLTMPSALAMPTAADPTGNAVHPFFFSAQTPLVSQGGCPPTPSIAIDLQRTRLTTCTETVSIQSYHFLAHGQPPQPPSPPNPHLGTLPSLLTYPS